jgi:radical SAM superfamily enzyme YgiQ (UPF0313 family)
MKILFLTFQENADVIGVKYLNAYVTAHGHAGEMLLIPNDHPVNVETALDHAADSKPDVLCLSAMSYEFPRARRFAQALRARIPDCPIIIGGIHATTDPESCLEVADVVVRGEGEETLLELLECLGSPGRDGLAHIKGIVYRQDEKVVHTDVRQPLQDLDAIPYPGHLPDALYVVHEGRIRCISEPQIRKRYARYQGTFLSVVSSRGCPFSCSYCCNSSLRALYGPCGVRNRAPGKVIEEIAQEVRGHPHILYVNFQDDCFMLHPTEWLAEFARGYADEVGIPFIVRTTPRHITREKLVLLREAGLRWVFMGLQTGSDRVNQQIYGRNVTADEFLEAARTVSGLGLSPWYDVILDNPFETEEEHLATIDVLLRTPRPFQLDLFSLDYFPGTEIRKRALEEGIEVPELGTKSYTEPEPAMINRYIRMSATLPPWLVRRLVDGRHSTLGRTAGMAAYPLALLLEPFVYIRLIHRANDHRIPATLKVIRAFYVTAVNKLLLRKQG